MALNPATAAAAVVSAEGALPIDSSELSRMTAMLTAVFDHIKANMIVTSSGSDPQGGTVTSTSTTVV